MSGGKKKRKTQEKTRKTENGEKEIKGNRSTSSLTPSLGGNGRGVRRQFFFLFEEEKLSWFFFCVQAEGGGGRCVRKNG